MSIYKAHSVHLTDNHPYGIACEQIKGTTSRKVTTYEFAYIPEKNHLINRRELQWFYYFSFTFDTHNLRQSFLNSLGRRSPCAINFA